MLPCVTTCDSHLRLGESSGTSVCTAHLPSAGSASLYLLRAAASVVRGSRVRGPRAGSLSVPEHLVSGRPHTLVAQGTVSHSMERLIKGCV